MHFVRLAIALPKDKESNKLFLISLLTSPAHLKYVPTRPCNISLIACFLALMFHKVVW